MGSLLLAAALAVSAFAGDAIPTSKIAPKKTSPARRVYDYVLTTGYRAEMPPTGPGWDGRKVWELQAPNYITVLVLATKDEGLPLCRVQVVGREGKVSEAVQMGLPVPLFLFDRGCTGLVKDVRATFADPKTHQQSDAPMTQRQLDIFFGLMEDCLKNGI